MTIESMLSEDVHSSSPATESNAAESNASGDHAENHDGRRQRRSFRRRRRRSFGSNPGQPNSGQEGSSASPATEEGGSQADGASSGTEESNRPARQERQPRRHKKRFFRKGRGQNPNQNQAQGQGRGQGSPRTRKSRDDSRGNSQHSGKHGSKQRRPKVFVGPMDHSYRAVNGNYADAPPSTIDLQRGFRKASFNGNGNGNVNGNVSFESDGWGSSRAAENVVDAAALENMPVRIYCFIDDLFFVAKIHEAARKLGIRVNFVKNDKDTISELLALPEEERPGLIVFDLNNANAKPLTLIPKLKLKLKRSTSIVGFLSHLQGELKAKAIEAGCDTVMPRSAFSQNLPNLLRRYGVEVEPELDDSQAQMLEG